MSWLSPEDRELVAALRGDWTRGGRGLSALFDRAQRHGLGDVVDDAAVAAGIVVDDDLRRSLDHMRVARDLDHAAHAAMLRAVDGALAEAQIRTVVLKGVLFAERFYARPSGRPTSDIDLLVALGDLRAAQHALETVGYRMVDDDREQAWSLREHHHLHLAHPHALPLELHFHAYRGFGSVIDGAAVVTRSIPSDRGTYRALRVLAPEDELVFLAVHAAAHRFVRLGWLYDIKLLLATMSPAQVQRAAERAASTGYAFPVGLAATLLVESLGVAEEAVAPLLRLDHVRGPLLRAMVAEPRNPVLRSATRFAYTMMLCDDVRGALGYSLRSSRGHVGRILGSLGRRGIVASSS